LHKLGPSFALLSENCQIKFVPNTRLLLKSSNSSQTLAFTAGRF